LSPAPLPQPAAVERRRLIVVAIWLSSVSVVWGLLSGTVSVVVGILDGSLGVVGLGLNVLADLTGSVALIWRFRAELRHGALGAHFEQHAARVVAGALMVVSLVLTVSGIQALAAGSHPGHSTLGLVIAGLAVAIQTPLAVAKRRVAAQLGSGALRGDGALTGIGAAIGVLALTGLWLDDAFGWWWADRLAALVVAAIAALEARRALRDH
jgi:divalent metal cation (Fe/Co/Zn/Cd) transporter